MKKWKSLVVMATVLFGAAYLAFATESGRNVLNSTATTRAMLESIDKMLATDGANSVLLDKREKLVRELASQGIDAASVDQSRAETKSIEYLRSQGVDVPDAPNDYIANLLMRLQAGQQLTESEKAELEVSGVFDEHGRNPLDNQGGPDTYGYRWVDNLAGDTATYLWEDIVGAPGAVNLTAIGNNDDAATAVALSFTFPFYATTVSTIYPSTNGAIGMTSVTSFSNTCTLPTTTFPAGGIWPFWDDQHTGRGGTGVSGTVSDSGSIWVKDEGTRVIVQWDSVGRLSPTYQHTYTYQAILYADGKIKFQYQNIARYAPSTTFPSATIGIQQGSTAPNNNFLTYLCSTTAVQQQDTIRDRAVWFYPPLVAPTGRCCYWDGAAEQCTENTSVDCAALNGSWQIAATCAGSPCPTARCCYNGGASCGDFTAQHCTALGGTWTSGFTCAANPCPIALEGGETCADRVTVAVGQQWSSSTAGNAPEVGIPACGTGYNTTALGEWYSVIGNGNTLTLSLCDVGTTFDTEAFVFCGDCGNFTCIDGDDDDCTTPALASTITWCAELGREYFVLITAFGSGSGPYLGVITDGAPCANPINCTPLGRCCYLNNGIADCVDNLSAECTVLGGQWDQSVLCATAPCPTGRCCYLDAGHGACATNTQLECNVLNGTWSTGLACETTPCTIGRCCYDDAGTPACANVMRVECTALSGVWDSLQTCESAACPTILQGTDDCVDATLIPALNAQYVGTNVGFAGDSTLLPDCATWYNINNPAGVWYKFMGTGNTITISLCDALTNYDTEIGVFCGPTCDSLVCVGSDDDFCTTPGLASELTVCTVLGAEYKLLVTTFSNTSSPNAGTFAFILTDDGVACVPTIVCPVVTIPCDPVVDLVAYIVTVGSAPDHFQLKFTAPQNADYKVWYSTNPNNDGNPDDGSDVNFVLESVLPGVTAGPVTWDGANTFDTYRYYVVTASCGN